MSYLTDDGSSGLGEARYKWDGGKSGDVDEKGILYGTPMEEALAIIAKADAAKQKADFAAREALLAKYVPTAAATPISAPSTAPMSTPLAVPASTVIAAPVPVAQIQTPQDSTKSALVIGGSVVAAIALAYFLTRKK